MSPLAFGHIEQSVGVHFAGARNVVVVDWSFGNFVFTYVLHH